MFAIGNDELEECVAIGETIVCPHCQEIHDIKYGDEIMSDGTKKPSKILAFYTCGNNIYLAGIDGKMI